MARWAALITMLGTPWVWATEPPPPDPAQPVNYVAWLNEKYGQGIENNAADVYEKAEAAFVEDEDLLDLAVKSDPQRWMEGERGKLQAYIERNAEALKYYAQAARLPACYFTLRSESGEMTSVMTPKLGVLGPLAKLTAGRARLRLTKGDLDGAIHDVATLMRAGRHLQEQPTTIHLLVGVTTSLLAYEVLFDLLGLTPGSVDYIDVVKKLRSVDKPPRRPTRQLESELLNLWDVAQRLLEDVDGDGRYDHLGHEDPKLALDPPWSLDDIMGPTREYMASCEAAYVPGYEASRQRFEEIEQMLQSQKGKTLLGIFPPPSFAKVAELQRKFIAMRNACRVTFMLHAYHAKHDKWPDDLEAALPGKNIKAALDPFSNTLFRYELRGGEPFLYSVGVNGVDDGGEIVRKDGRPTWAKTGDYVFWPRR